MRKAIALIAIMGLLAMPAMAQTYSNTLYGQEGTVADGVNPPDASGQGPAGDAGHSTNWKYQYGSGTWAGVYSWDGDAWLEVYSTGDSEIEVECDIEMYWSESIADNKIYFHLGDPFNATAGDKTAIVSGTYACNHLMYLGISFAGTTKEEADFETGGPTGYTGRVFDGMVGTIDNHGVDISAESFDIVFLMNCNGGAYTTPCNFGVGAHATILSTLWWHPTDVGMTIGSGVWTWKVIIEPPAGQADGNYVLDPEIVAAPQI
jgi:hypothetical protein